MSWFELHIESCPAEERELLMASLFEQGAAGIDETDSQSVRAYFEKDSIDAVLSQWTNLEAQFSSEVQVRVRSVVEQDWAERWKQYYQPQPLGTRFFIRPVWMPSVEIPKGRIPLDLAPGQAFGTGLHPSTQLCVEYLEELGSGCRSMIDIGTGSGILSIAAAKLGIDRIVAIDNDPVAVEVAEENCVINECDHNVEVGNALSPTRSYDLVVANILLETHVALVSQYKSQLGPGAVLILAGLLRDQQEEIESKLLEQGLHSFSTKTSGEWLAIAAKSGIAS